MPVKSLIFLAFKDFFSRKGRLFLSIIGIICGVASILFLLSLLESVKRTVKNELIGKIPITEMTVKPKEVKRGYSLVSDYSQFNDDLVDYMMTELPGVKEVYPVQSLDIPAEIDGRVKFVGVPIGSFRTETAVFGLSREVIIDGLKNPERYVFDPDASRVPAVISSNMLELYNISFAKTLGYGRFHQDALIGQEFEMRFEMISGITPEEEIEIKGKYGLDPVQVRIIGVSPRAPIMGISVPLEYIQYWRERYWRGDITKLGEKKTYEFIILRTENINYVKPVRKALEGKGLEVQTQKETIEKINSVSLIISIVFATFGIIILVISAISIFNILAMSVNEEKVDIGILRSVGARKSHIRLIYLLKAGLIGFIGAIDGILVGYIIMRIGDRVMLSYFKDIPFAPESFFAPTWKLVLGCFFIGFFFSILAGIGPANHAARLKPSIVLRQG